jgi:hypothetical protein
LVENELVIRKLVKMAVESYAQGFETRHIMEYDDPDGVINMKIHNIFIAALGPEIQYYTALVRSLDSSLGNMLEKLAINIAELYYTVSKFVEGPLYPEQTAFIAKILEEYKRHSKKPETKDYLYLRSRINSNSENRRHDSDYYLIDKATNDHYLIELKTGGDLDNKKARSEKEAILEQYAILSNTLKEKTKITIYFATAYNRFGEDNPWKQERVRQFFAEDELLIGKDFWNFICKSDNGYQIVLSEYKKHSKVILKSLEKIKRKYLGVNYG